VAAPRPHLSLPRSLVALAAAGLVAAAPAARANDAIPKTVVIVGTLGTWAVAGFGGHPVDCLMHGPATNDGWGARAQYGQDNELQMFSLAAVRRDCEVVGQIGPFSLDVAPVIGLTGWHASEVSPATDDHLTAGHSSAWDLAFVPMFHWKLPVGGGGMLFDTEFGIGPAYLSTPEIGTRHKSTNFQFSDHMGLGLGSADGRWRFSVEYRHISNANIQLPNNGVDFLGVAMEWKP
jgi:hypothetical protein